MFRFVSIFTEPIKGEPIKGGSHHNWDFYGQFLPARPTALTGTSFSARG
jgi:hypothetical protein